MLVIVGAFTIFVFGIITRFCFKRNDDIQNCGLAAFVVGGVIFFSLLLLSAVIRSDNFYNSVAEKRDAIVDALEHSEKPDTIAKAFSNEIQGLNIQINESKKMRDNIFVGCLVNYDIGSLEPIIAENYY